jgi:hypothetical protein
MSEHDVSTDTDPRGPAVDVPAGADAAAAPAAAAAGAPVATEESIKHPFTMNGEVVFLMLCSLCRQYVTLWARKCQGKV